MKWRELRSLKAGRCDRRGSWNMERKRKNQYGRDLREKKQRLRETIKTVWREGIRKMEEVYRSFLKGRLERCKRRRQRRRRK